MAKHMAQEQSQQAQATQAVRWTDGARATLDSLQTQRQLSIRQMEAIIVRVVERARGNLLPVVYSLYVREACEQVLGQW